MELDWLKKVFDQSAEVRKQCDSTIEPLALTLQCELARVNAPRSMRRAVLQNWPS